jgi:hypothetical protein
MGPSAKRSRAARSLARHNLPVLPLVGFFLLTFAVLWILRQIPGLGAIFGIPFLGFFLAAILVSALLARFGSQAVDKRRFRRAAVQFGTVETPHNQGKLGSLMLAAGRAAADASQGARASPTPDAIAAASLLRRRRPARLPTLGRDESTPRRDAALPGARPAAPRAPALMHSSRGDTPGVYRAASRCARDRGRRAALARVGEVAQARQVSGATPAGHARLVAASVAPHDRSSGSPAPDCGIAARRIGPTDRAPCSGCDRTMAEAGAHTAEDACFIDRGRAG